MDPTSRAFFDDLYTRAEDPWRFATDPYEGSRYDALIAALGARTFAAGFEPGCSIGVLTRRLAARCRQLDAMDISTLAVRRARARCSDLPGVAIRTGRLPEDLPRPGTDLVVLGEVGYYLTEDDLRRTLDALAARVVRGGRLVATHWTGESPDHVLSGAAVHDAIDAHPALRCLRHAEAPGYLLGSWQWR